MLSLFRDIDQKRKIEKLRGDVRPSEEALVLLYAQEQWQPVNMRWGFLGKEKHRLIINARAETVVCISPAVGGNMRMASIL